MGSLPVRANLKTGLLWFLLLSIVFLSFFVTALTYGTEQNWIGHAMVSIAGLGLIILVVFNGATLTGRLRTRTGSQTFVIHKQTGIVYSVFMIGSFVYGLWVVTQHGESLLTSIHGWLGVFLAVFAVVQLVPSVVIKRRLSIKLSHMIFGYASCFLLVIQTAWGLEIAVIGFVKDQVMIHSVFGAVAGFAFSWIILEMLRFGPKSLPRAKLAGVTATFFNVIGCWIVGGYYYFTTYSKELRNVIKEGPQDWAHEIVMETKEHVFIFLPIISFVILFLLLSAKSEELLTEDSKTKKSILGIAVMALAFIVVLFIFGVLISNAARISSGGN